MTSSVSRKRSPTELIARGGGGNRTRVQGFAGPCLSHSATPPADGVPTVGFRADDGIRTRDPHLGKVMRYQLRYVRVCSVSAAWWSNLNPKLPEPPHRPPTGGGPADQSCADSLSSSESAMSKSSHEYSEPAGTASKVRHRKSPRVVAQVVKVA